MRLDNDFGLLFWLHNSFIVGALISPFFFHMYYVYILLGLYGLQFLLLGHCVLSAWQFKKQDSFYHHYLSKYFGVKASRKVIGFYVNRLFPGIIFFTTII